MDGEPPNVLIPGILRVVPARVIDARGLEKQTARAGLGAKREDVGPGNSERSTVSIPVDVSQVKESTLLVLIKAFYLLCNNTL